MAPALNRVPTNPAISLLALRAVIVWIGVSGWVDPPQALADDQPAAAAVVQNQAISPLDGNVEFVEIQRDLRSQDFRTRQQATLKLWGNRERYRSWVERALNDPDPEVAKRANWVLERWRRGILPETPRDIAEQLAASNSADTIENLFNAGLFEGALVAIDETITGAASPAILDRARAAIRRRFPFYIRLADANQQLPVFVELLDRLADDALMSNAYLQLKRKVHGDNDLKLPSSAKQWPNSQRETLDVILHAANGQLEQAAQAAEQATEPELLRVVFMLQGNWAALTQSEVARASSAPPGSLEWYRHWMYALIAASRANNAEVRALAVQHLSEPAPDASETDGESTTLRMRWQTLAMHGELDAAKRLLLPGQPDVAAELLAQSSRYPDAFEAIQVSYREVDGQIAQLVQDAVTAERDGLNAPSLDSERSPALLRLLTLVRLLTMTGRDELAKAALTDFLQHPAMRNQNESLASRIAILKTLIRLNRLEWISDLLIPSGAEDLPRGLQLYLALAFDVESETIGTLMDVLPRLRPQSTFAVRLKDTIDLIAGKTPAWLLSPHNQPQAQNARYNDGFESLYIVLFEGRKVMRRSLEGVNVLSVPQLSVDFAKLFELHGQSALAKRTLTHLASNGDVEALQKLAETELNEGRAGEARKYFLTVWQSVDSSGKDPARLHLADQDALLAMRSIQGEATAAARQGDQEHAEHLNRLIELMACSPSATLQDSFAQYLVEQQRNELAGEIYEPLLSLAAFGTSEGVEFYSLSRNYDAAVGTTKPAAAVAMLDLAIAGTIETTMFYPGAYVSLPAYLHRRNIQLAVDQRDETKVRATVESLFKLDPIDIDFGEKVLKSMRTVGMQDLAQEIIERIYQAGAAHLQRFPTDASTANNLAWIMSLSDHRLEDALNFSRKAVCHEPDSTVYRDTLAEVLFRLGRKTEAIAIEESCLLDDPGEWHIHEQLQRFRSGGEPPAE